MKLHPIKVVLIFILSVLVISCTSSEKNETEKETIETHIKLFAHGTAQIACTIVELKEVKSQTICVAIIDTIFGYGAGTRPIGVNSKLDLSIENSLDKDILKKDSKYRLTLRYTNERFGGAVDYPWQIIKLNNKLN